MMDDDSRTGSGDAPVEDPDPRAIGEGACVDVADAMAAAVGADVVNGCAPDGAPDGTAGDQLSVEDLVAARKLSSIEAGRRKGGLVGAAMAGAMLTLHEIYEGPVYDADIMVVSESPDDPTDIDVDGIEVSVGDVNVWSPPPSARAD